MWLSALGTVVLSLAHLDPSLWPYHLLALAMLVPSLKLGREPIGALNGTMLLPQRADALTSSRDSISYGTIL
jgi:hypothetical protein